MNCELSDLAWIQAGLPIRDGGLGVRSVALLAPSAFLASAAATLDLQDAVLSEMEQEADNYVPRVAARWSEMFEAEPLSGSAARSQRSWDGQPLTMGKLLWCSTTQTQLTGPDCWLYQHHMQVIGSWRCQLLRVASD